MAQQITNNNSILDLMVSANTNYADTSVTNFDNVLNVANKTLTKKQNSITDTKLFNTAKTVETRINDTSKSAVGKSSSYTANTNTGVKSNLAEPVSGKTKDTGLKEQDAATSVDSSNEKTVEDTAETEDIQDTQDVVEKVEDVVSKYTYLQDTEIVQEELPAVVTEETTDEVDSDVEVSDTEIDAETGFDETFEFPETHIDANNVELTVTRGDAAVNTKIEQPLVKTDDTVTVDVSKDLLNAEDIQPTQNNKTAANDLISQKMVDELNITIEEVSENVSTEETQDTSILMDSTEQTVKYMMDKESELESQVSVDKNENLDLGTVKEEVVDEEVAVQEDTAEITDDLIVNSDDKSDTEMNSSDDIDTVETQDVEQTADSDTANDSQTGEGEQDSSENHKSDIKKEAFTADETYNDVVDADVDTYQTDSKLTGAVEAVSHTKGRIQGVQSLESQTFVSASNQNNVSKEDVIAQIHTKLQTMNSTTNTKLTMVLNPESLGKVSIQLINTKDGLTAEMQVASQSVKDILDNNLSNLKETLSAQGVQVNDVSVKVSQTDNNAEMDYTEQEGNGGNKQEQSANHDDEQDKEKFEKMFANSIESAEQREEE